MKYCNYNYMITGYKMNWQVNDHCSERMMWNLWDLNLLYLILWKHLKWRLNLDQVLQDEDLLFVCVCLFSFKMNHNLLDCVLSLALLVFFIKYIVLYLIYLIWLPPSITSHSLTHFCTYIINIQVRLEPMWFHKRDQLRMYWL